MTPVSLKNKFSSFIHGLRLLAERFTLETCIQPSMCIMYVLNIAKEIILSHKKLIRYQFLHPLHVQQYTLISYSLIPTSHCTKRIPPNKTFQFVYCLLCKTPFHKHIIPTSPYPIMIASTALNDW